MATPVKPTLTINSHDYAKYVESIEISRNDLDADGSGRDVQTGLMYRTRIATKLKADIKMLPLQESVHKQLLDDIKGVYFYATIVNPVTGAAESKQWYISTVPFGAQRYNKETGKPYYSGMTFSITER